MQKVSMIATAIAVVSLSVNAEAKPNWDNTPAGYSHGTVVEVDGAFYLFKGPGSEAGVVDVPGHIWRQAGPYQVIGRHYNVGPTTPNGPAPSWWATGEPDGALLFVVHGIFDFPPDQLSPAEEAWLKDQGYIHVHELIDLETGEESEDVVVYLKHIAVSAFLFDGGPMRPNYMTRPGVDFSFMPNW